MWVCLSPCPCGCVVDRGWKGKKEKYLWEKKLSHNWDMNPPACGSSALTTEPFLFPFCFSFLSCPFLFCRPFFLPFPLSFFPEVLHNLLIICYTIY